MMRPEHEFPSNVGKNFMSTEVKGEQNSADYFLTVPGFKEAPICTYK